MVPGNSQKHAKETQRDPKRFQNGHCEIPRAAGWSQEGPEKGPQSENMQKRVCFYVFLASQREPKRALEVPKKTPRMAPDPPKGTHGDPKEPFTRGITAKPLVNGSTRGLMLTTL